MAYELNKVPIQALVDLSAMHNFLELKETRSLNLDMAKVANCIKMMNVDVDLTKKAWSRR